MDVHPSLTTLHAPHNSTSHSRVLSSGHSKAETTRDPAVLAELVDMYHRRAPAPVLALNIVVAALLVVLLWGQAPVATLLGWFGAVSLIAIANILCHRRYRQSLRHPPIDAVAWERAFVRGSIAHGIGWGMAGVLLYNPATPLQSSFILLIMCGMSAGVAASQAALWRSVVLFSLTTLLPPALTIALIGSPLHLVVSLLVLIFLGFTLYIGRANHLSAVDTILLRFRNDHLLHELEEREQHFRALVENAPDMVIAIDAGGTLLFHSPSTETVLGPQPEAELGGTVFDLIHPDDHPQVRAEMARLLNGTVESAETEVRARRSDGHWIVLHCVARRLEGTVPPALVVNARDMTERRAMEDALRAARDEAERASQVKSQFLATMSHEIRTPMHAILGMAELLQDSPLNTSQQGYVQTFQAAGRHLLALIDDILDFSRIEAGGLQLAKEPFHLGRLLDEVQDMLGAQARAKGLQLRLNLQPEVGLPRRGDAQRLRQVLVNLIGNAIKFTDQGHIDLTVSTGLGATDSVLFSVSDTGIGIAPERLTRLFAPFTQIDAGRTRGHGGTGLGLSISQRLIKAMGGLITVESTPGEGTRFSFTLELAPCDDVVLAKATSLDDLDVMTLPPGQILIADDSAMNRLVLKEFLRESPCRIEFAHNGIKALEMFEQTPFDLVLMDMQMPQLDGWSATRKIREFESRNGLPEVPVIALTASATEEDRQAAVLAGCTNFCPKPLNRSQLFALLRHYIKPARGATLEHQASL